MKTFLRACGALALLLALAAGATGLSAQESEVIHGFVRQAETGEPVPQSSLTVDGRLHGQSNGDGYFSFPRLDAGEHRIVIRAVGFEPLDTLVRTSSAPLELRLRSAPTEIPGITVRASRALERPFEAPEVSVRTVTPAEIRRVPAALEADLFRSIQALPGVVSPGVLSSRLLVRGGAADQNLFLLDGYPVLQPYHLGGGFSAFHTEAVRDAELWIGAPPARYGGALSSVLDVSLREGNRERTTGTATLGLVTSSAVVEGGHPRGAWFVGARRTYIDQAAKGRGANLPYYFYDAYAKGHADLTPSDRVSLLVFLGRDQIYNERRRERERFEWSNEVYGVSWRHLFGGRAVFEQRASLSRFAQELRGGYTNLQHSRIGTDHLVSLAQLRGDLQWEPAEGHRVETGYLVQREAGDHRVEYSAFGKYDDESMEVAGQAAGALLAAYVQDEVTLSPKLRARLGLRGEAAGEHRSLQPRLSARYLLSDRLALTAGGGLVRQYGQTMQDPDANFDVYSVDLVTSAYEPDAPAASASHLVGGLEAKLPHEIRFRAEGYAKHFGGLSTIGQYDPEAQRFAVERIESATGEVYGLDLSLGREAPGRVRGWLGYSLTSSTRTVDGARFAAELQPRHRFVAVWETEPRRGWSFTGRFEGFEGIPFTPVTAMVPARAYDFQAGRFSDLCSINRSAFTYGDRNSARTEFSKRLDLGAGKRWSDRRGWKWELSLSLLNTLFDPVGLFRPAPTWKQNGCGTPSDVVWETEYVLPPVPSVGVRVAF